MRDSNMLNLIYLFYMLGIIEVLFKSEGYVLLVVTHVTLLSLIRRF